VDANTFNKVFAETVQKSSDVLVSKAGEYADDFDRLRNFKTAAALKDETAIKALSGMLAKHTVSIYELMGRNKVPPLALWDEKIIDHINYLILLRAVVVETLEEGDN
jgi:hypothetical protein